MDFFEPSSGRQVFFLGAGAAAVSGVPLIQPFRQASRRVLEADEFATTQRRQLFGNGLRVWDKWGPRLTIEELYVLADLKSRVWRSINSRTQELEAVQYLIAETIEKESNEEGQAVHDLFVAHVAAQTEPTIVSTNWDISIDNAILRRGMDVNYAGGSLLLFQNQTPLETGQGIRYLKLHGSLNWGRCQKEGCGWTAFRAEKIAAGAFVNNEFQCGTCQDRGLAPAFIPPLAQKMETAQLELVTIWQSAFRALRQASQIIVIGYSLPLTDIQVQMLFVDAIGRDDSNVEAVHIIGPKDPSRDERFRILGAKVPRAVSWQTHDLRYEEWVKGGFALDHGRQLTSDPGIVP